MSPFQFTHDTSGGGSRQQLKAAATNYDEGKALHHAGDYEAALDAYRQALAIREPFLGKYHWDTIKTYWRMGRSHWLLAEAKTNHDGGPNSSPNQLKQQQAAVRCWKRAMRLAERLQGKDHPITERLSEDISRFLSTKTGDNSVDSKVDMFKTIQQWLEHERQGDLSTKGTDYRRALKHYHNAMKLEQQIFSSAPSSEDMDSTVSTKNSITSCTASVVSTGSLDGADLACKMAGLYKLQGDLKASLAAYEMAHDCYVVTWGDVDHPAKNGAAASIQAIHTAGGAERTSAERSRRFRFRGVFANRRQAE